MRDTPEVRPGFVLPQVLLALSLVVVWGAMAMAQAMGSLHEAILTREALEMRLAIAVGTESARTPPDVALLCSSSPLAPHRRVQEHADGGSTAIRWWHLRDGIVLAEVQVVGGRGGRARSLLWMTPEVVESEEGGVRCAGSHLRTLADGSAIPKPGE